jgi:hypothetical protein
MLAFPAAASYSPSPTSKISPWLVVVCTNTLTSRNSHSLVTDLVTTCYRVLCGRLRIIAESLQHVTSLESVALRSIARGLRSTAERPKSDPKSAGPPNKQGCSG